MITFYNVYQFNCKEMEPCGLLSKLLFLFFFLGVKTKDTGNASDSHFFFVIAKYEYKSKYFRSKVAIQKIKTEQTAREIILMAF